MNHHHTLLLLQKQKEEGEEHRGLISGLSVKHAYSLSKQRYVPLGRKPCAHVCFHRKNNNSKAL
jgi:hypothetical protein